MMTQATPPELHPEPGEEDRVYAKVGRRLLPLLLCCYTFAYLDRVNIGFAKLQMQQDIPGLDEAAFGLGAGLFFLAYACLEIPSNLLMHRIGARRTITRIMVLWGLASAAMMFVRDPASFYILRILLGVFEAGFAPGIILYLTYWFPARRMAAAMGIYMLAGPIGSMFGSLLSAFIIKFSHNLLGLAGWQWMFVIEGLPCVVLGIVFWKVMADRPGQAKWLTGREKQLVEQTVAGSEATGTQRFTDALKQPQVHIMALAYFGIMCGIYATSFWLPTILKDNGMKSTFQVGLVTAIPYALSIVVIVLATRSSDRRRDRKWHSIIPTAIAAVALVLAVFTAANFWVAFAAMTVCVCGVWVAYTVFWAVPTEHLGGTGAAGGIAYINTIGILGGFVAPYLIGLIKQATGSTQWGLLSMVGLLLISLVALFFIRRAPAATAESAESVAAPADIDRPS